MYLPVVKVFFYHFQTFFLILNDIEYVSYTLLFAICRLFLIILNMFRIKVIFQDLCIVYEIIHIILYPYSKSFNFYPKNF